MACVYNAFRGPALKWLEALKTFCIDDKSWVDVKAELLDAYSRVQTALTTTVNLADLKQAANESITDFSLRVAIIVEDIKQLMPVAIRVPQGVTWDATITGLAGWNGVGAGIKAAILQQAADKVRWASFNHLGVQLFVSNLKPVLREKLMKAPPALLNAAIKMARSLEKIQLKNDSGHAHATVSELQPHQQQHSNDNTLDAESEALSTKFQTLLNRRNGTNVQCGGLGNGNNQRGQGRGHGGRGSNTTGYNVCRYCKTPGHLQKVCNSRIKVGVLEVETQGKPYTHANELDNGNTTDGAGAAAGHVSNPWQQQPDPYDYRAMEEIYRNSPDFI